MELKFRLDEDLEVQILQEVKSSLTVEYLFRLLGQILTIIISRL